MPLNPTPYRQKILTFLSPKVADFLISETVDITRRTIPEYGTAHYDTKKYPNHFFCYSKLSDKDDAGLIYTFYYAAKRDSQDEYNWEYVQADINGKTARDGQKFDAVTRTYVTLRSEFNPDSPTMGDLMVNVPEDEFTGVYQLSSREQKRIGQQELDSLFVVETLTYIKKVALRETRYDETVGRGDGNVNFIYFKGESPPEYPNTKIEDIFYDPSHPFWGLNALGVIRNGDQLSDHWFAVQEASVVAPNADNTAENPAKKRMITRITPLGTDLLFIESGTTFTESAPAYGTPHYDTVNWPNHKLVFIAPNSQDRSGVIFDFYYVADRDNQQEYNLEKIADAVSNDFGYTTYRRTYIHLRHEGDTVTFHDPVAGTVELKRETTLTGLKELDGLYEKTVIIYGTSPQNKISKVIDKSVPDKFLTLSKKQVIRQTSLTPLTISDSVLIGNKEELTQDGRVYIKDTTVQTGIATLNGSRSYVEREPVTITESIVADTTQADTGVSIFDSQVTAIGNGLAVKTTATAQSLGPYTEWEWDEVLGVSIRYTEYYSSTPVYAPNTSVRCINKDRYLIRTYTPPTDLSHLNYEYAGTTNMDFPPVFEGATVYWDKSTGTGDYNSDWSGYSFGSSPSLSGDENGSASAYATVHPVVSVRMSHKSGRNLPTKTQVFYAPLGREFTNFMPQIETSSFSITAVTQKVNVSVKVGANARASVQFDKNGVTTDESASKTTGSGSDKDLTISTDVITVGPCIINGAVQTGSQSATTTAIATVGWSGVNFPAVSVNKTATGVATGSVSSNIQSTPPLPTGNFIIDVNVRPYKWGLALYSVTTVTI